LRQSVGLEQINGMFVGHYGVAFAVKTERNKIPLWVLFVGVQLLDFLWAPFVLLGIEKVRFVPGITATNALDLYYMPYCLDQRGVARGIRRFFALVSRSDCSSSRSRHL